MDYAFYMLAGFTAVIGFGIFLWIAHDMRKERAEAERRFHERNGPYCGGPATHSVWNNANFGNLADDVGPNKTNIKEFDDFTNIKGFSKPPTQIGFGDSAETKEDKE